LFSADVVLTGPDGIGRVVSKLFDIIKYKESIGIFEKLPTNVTHPQHYDSIGPDLFIEIIDEYKNRKDTPIDIVNLKPKSN